MHGPDYCGWKLRVQVSKGARTRRSQHAPWRGRASWSAEAWRWEGHAWREAGGTAREAWEEDTAAAAVGGTDDAAAAFDDTAFAAPEDTAAAGTEPEDAGAKPAVEDVSAWRRAMLDALSTAAALDEAKAAALEGAAAAPEDTAAAAADDGTAAADPEETAAAAALEEATAAALEGTVTTPEEDAPFRGTAAATVARVTRARSCMVAVCLLGWVTGESAVGARWRELEK